MRILIVDDDAGTRGIIRRVLAHDLKCDVGEAADGTQALAALQGTETFDAVVLDLQMPTMGGLETLAHIRKSERHAAIPVIVLTADAGEQAVRQVAVLGIHAYLTKPINPARLSTRFKGILEQIARQADPSAAHHTLSPEFELDPARPVLVADGDPDFRVVLVGALAERVNVVEAENGFKALQALMVKNEASQPQMVLLGPNTGLLSGPLLVDKIRKLPGPSRPRVVGVYPPEQSRDTLGPAVFDAFIPRVSQPEVLLAGFDALWGAPRGLLDVLQRHPRFPGDLAADVVAVMRTRLNIGVSPLDGVNRPQEGPLVEARIALKSDRPALTLELTVHAPHERARSVVARLLQQDADTVSDDEVGTVVGSAILALAGRMEHRLGEAGLTTRLQPAEVEQVTGPVPLPDDPGAFALGFRGEEDAGLVLSVSLSQLA
jgi:two-component system chemotaxis response regulator CheY